MKKNYLFLGIALVVGLAVGWLVFGNNNDDNNPITDKGVSEIVTQMWTCSMHPQIMQTEPGDCPICGMDLIPATSGADGLAINQIKMTENAMALANIQTTIVGNATQSSDGMISLSGKIATNEENNAVQASYFDGRIETLNVNYEGQKVNRGQLLATIYAPTLVAAQQELITAASLKNSQPALYKAVRNKLKNWKLSDSQIDAIESSGTPRENFPVYATVSGTVLEVMAREGDYVKQGQPILKVTNLNSVWAEFDVYENQIANLKKGQNIEVVTNAYPNKKFDATVSFIDPVLNTSTRTVTIRATLKNTEDLLKPGMFVTGKLQGSTEMVEEMLAVPATAVMWTGERSVVYIKTNPNEPVFEMREVTLGNRNADTFTITDGLKNGDEIVISGAFTVDAAAQLQGKKSMMNQGVGEKSAMPNSEMKMELTESVEKDLINALEPYLLMKDAFVESDVDQVALAAKATSKALKSIAIEKLGQMEKSHLKTSIEMLDAISENAELENQRSHFVILNENMVSLVMNIKNIEAQLFVQKCPMANNNKGAIWLSSEKEIRNPYYGEQMLRCGSIIDSVQ